MSYVIFGRAIKNEYISLSVLGTALGIGLLASSGGKKSSTPEPKTLAEKVTAAVPITAGTSEEEELMASIQKFIAEAEKESGGH